MLKPAFSTIACPDWTLQQVADFARQAGFEAVELRTFGPDSRQLVCDPSMTDEGKTREMFKRVGVEILSLATSVRFDEPIRPPVIGMAISDTERSVREGMRAVDLAVGLGCPVVRVFGFELPEREKPARGMARIARRLAVVLDHARTSGTKLVVENGGSFPLAEDLAELLARLGNPLLGAAYGLDTAVRQGDDPVAGARLLGNRLWVARINDWKGGRPVGLGEGELPCRDFVRALAETGFDGPVVFEWPKLWLPELASAEEVLPHAASAIFGWMGEGMGARGAASVAGAA